MICTNLGKHVLAVRDELVAYVTDCIWMAGAFGQLCHVKPARHRWGTVTKACSGQCLSRLLYGIGKRVWRVAFPDVIAQPRIDAADDDFHKVIKSKIQRSVRNFDNLTKQLHHCAVAFTSAPLDHLQQQLQQNRDVGILMELVRTDDNNPFVGCQLDLGNMAVWSIILAFCSLLFQYFRSWPRLFNCVNRPALPHDPIVYDVIAGHVLCCALCSKYDIRQGCTLDLETTPPTHSLRDVVMA